MYQTMSYEAQMEMKAEQVKNILNEAVNGEYLFEGVIKGEIIKEKRCDSGFGYDPIFFLPEYGCTSAELSPEKKNELSHRGEGLKKIRKILEQR